MFISQWDVTPKIIKEILSAAKVGSWHTSFPQNVADTINDEHKSKDSSEMMESVNTCSVGRAAFQSVSPTPQKK